MDVSMLGFVSVLSFCWPGVTAAFDSSVSRGWTVNPFRVAKPIAGAAGFVAPAFVRDNIRVLEEIFGVDDAQWTVFAKTVILKNCTIGVKNHTEPALRIGRLAIHWDSLTAPTIDIEVEDVGVNVEFINLIMTRNNWNEVIDGVSPLISSYEATSKWFQWDEDTTEVQDDFLFFNNIDLLGNITMKLKSRPLNKELGKVSLSFDIGDLTSAISAASERNHKIHGKRGCSTAELTTIIRRYFTRKFGVLIRSIVDDPHEAAAQANIVLTKAKALAINYTRETRSETLRTAAKLLVVHLGRLGEKLTNVITKLSRKINRCSNFLRRRLGLRTVPEPTLLLTYTNHTESEQTQKPPGRRWILF